MDSWNLPDKNLTDYWRKSEWKANMSQEDTKIVSSKQEVTMIHVSSNMPMMFTESSLLQCRSKGRGRGGPVPPSFFPKR